MWPAGMKIEPDRLKLSGMVTSVHQLLRWTRLARASSKIFMLFREDGGINCPLGWQMAYSPYGYTEEIT